MRILIADWLGTMSPTIEIERFDLENKNHLMGLILAAGTGRFEEACIEFDCNEAFEVVRGLVLGTGGAEKVECLETHKSRRLYRAGYEIYEAGEYVIYFLNPIPRPELFSNINDSGYVKEFDTKEGTCNF